MPSFGGVSNGRLPPRAKISPHSHRGGLIEHSTPVAKLTPVFIDSLFYGAPPTALASPTSQTKLPLTNSTTPTTNPHPQTAGPRFKGIEGQPLVRGPWPAASSNPRRMPCTSGPRAKLRGSRSFAPDDTGRMVRPSCVLSGMARPSNQGA